MHDEQKISVKGILHKDRKVLLLQDGSGKWELPGGKVEFGESLEKTLIREFSEEIGLEQQVLVMDIVHAWTFIVDKENFRRQYIILVYACETHEVTNNFSDEHVGFGWFTAEEVMNLELQDGYKDSIRKYFSKYVT